MLQYKNNLNISELKNFFSSQEKAGSKFFQILFSLSFTHAHYYLPIKKVVCNFILRRARIFYRLKSNTTVSWRSMEYKSIIRDGVRIHNGKINRL